MKNQTHTCPWQGGSLLANPIRKVMHNPRRILAPFLTDGMTAMDIGCGMGYFSIPMSGLVGDGKVIAVDLQPEMLEGLKRRASKKTCDNIFPHQCKTESLCLGEWEGKVDFALVFWMLHEVPDSHRLIREIFTALKDNGKLLFVEPKGHVHAEDFEKSLEMIKATGFKKISSLKIAFSRSVLLEKTKQGWR